MNVFEKIEPLIWIYLIVLMIIAQFKGLSYDIAKEKEDPSYKGRHSFSFKNGTIRFAIPTLVLSKSNNQDTTKRAKNYNKIILNIWVTITLLLCIYLFIK